MQNACVYAECCLYAAADCTISVEFRQLYYLLFYVLLLFSRATAHLLVVVVVVVMLADVRQFTALSMPL